MADRLVPEDGTEFSLGFITALVSEELVPCEEVLRRRGWAECPRSDELRVGEIQKWRKNLNGTDIIAYSVAIGRMGQVASALETFTFLTRCRPNDIFLTGIAGSLQADKVHKADVIIATEAHWQTQNRVSSNGECDEYRVYNNPLNGYDVDLSRQLQVFAKNKFAFKAREQADTGSWNVFTGDLFTWDYVLDSERVTSRVNKLFPKALCVEMEAGGFLSAIERFSKVNGRMPMRGFVIRGISDYAAKKDKSVGIRQQASRNAAEVAVTLAEHLIDVRMGVAP